MNKVFLIWNVVLTMVLIVLLMGSCVSATPDLTAAVKANREAIAQNREALISLGEITEEITLDNRNLIRQNRDFIQGHREAIISLGEVINQQAELVRQESSDLDQLMQLIKILSLL